MPEVRVTQRHALPAEEVKVRLLEFAEVLSRYKLRLDWHGDTGRVGGVPGVGGEVRIAPGSVEVVVTVSRLVTMMGLDLGKLESTIRRRLQAALT